ncbi:hypothetical protein HQO24_10255 [Rhodococcus fascians]|nr:hypothetical protein [Rhodococcus fascians]MBY4396938.1 hypothetical protein [Rhodococcus fascians]MBY4407417.1 hypothetical protein [Rhodococcus fascians]MBY4421454.1 hypothetical protein [Rhodococcus fascians]MBY4460793.1 hypothetical protein [Rhodococcus fascians]
MSEPLDLDAIEARASKATPGPWEHCTKGYDGFPLVVADGYGFPAEPLGQPGTHLIETMDADAEFIAHSRTDIPALVARVRELTPRVLEGDWESVRDALDALPEGAQIRWRTGVEGGVALAIQRPSLLGIVAWQLTGYPGYISSESIARDETPIEVIA